MGKLIVLKLKNVSRIISTIGISVKKKPIFQHKAGKWTCFLKVFLKPCFVILKTRVTSASKQLKLTQ